MKTISDFPDDLIGEILFRVPITSLCVFRSTCKKWNDLSKTNVFGNKAARNQPFLGFMLVYYNVCSLRFNYQGICNKDELFLDPSVKMIPELEDVLVSRISQCDGLLLCVTKYHSQLLVWNPYLGQTRRIQPSRNTLMRHKSYALGYEDNKNNRNHKILRFLYDCWEAKYEQGKYQIEVYDFSSNSWRILNVNTDSEEPNYHNTSVSLKGNTYFFGREEDYLVCFDFTAERFGTRLLLPFKPFDNCLHTVTLSCVRDEKLTLLYSHYEIVETIKIWISTKIEVNAISWSMFFKVDRNNLPHDFPHCFGNSIFFTDEEKKLAVLSRKRAYKKNDRRLCTIGEDRFIKYVDTGEGMNNRWDYSNLLSSSYLPSLVQV